MNVNDAFPSNYIKASDLGDKKVAVTIERVEMEKIGTDKKLVVYFGGKSKGLVLNKTNAKRISEIAETKETDEWPGVRIVLYSTETEFQGETVTCVRVTAMPKNSKPSAPPPPPAPKPDPEFQAGDDDVPF